MTIYTRKTSILSAVAYHPTIYFVPAELVAGNVGMNIALALIAYSLFRITILWAIVAIIAGHSYIGILYNRDPHIVSLMYAYGKFNLTKRRNIASEAKGVVKFVP